MSAINVTQEEADLLLIGLNMYADVQRNASGSVPDDVKALIAKITPAPVVAEQPANEPTAEQVEAHFAAEDKAAEAAFLADVPHEQVTHEDDATQDGHE
jgi:hypothetical protein